MAAKVVKVSRKKMSLKERNWSKEARKCLWDISCVNYTNRDAKECNSDACTAKDTRDMSRDCSLHV